VSAKVATPPIKIQLITNDTCLLTGVQKLAETARIIALGQDLQGDSRLTCVDRLSQIGSLKKESEIIRVDAEDIPVHLLRLLAILGKHRRV
jgi:hypothetical protein